MSTPFNDSDFVPSQESAAFNDSDFVPAGNPNQAGINYLQSMSPNPLDFRNVLAGLGNMGQMFHNAPYNIANYLSSKGLLNPGDLSYLPQPTNVNTSASFGIPNPSGADQFVQNLSQWGPSAALDLPGAVLFGATQTKNPVYGATLSGVSTALSPVVGAAVKGISAIPGAVSSSVKDYLSGYAAPELTNTLNKNLSDIKTINNAQAFQMAKNNLEQNWEPQEQGAWNQAREQAQIADQNPNVNFDDSSYMQALKDKMQSQKKISNEQSGEARANADSLNLLQGYANDQHGTFTDAINHNQALNKDFRNQITPGVSLPFNTVNFAKNALGDTFQKNIQANGLQDTLGQAYQNANAITQQKNQIFNQLTTAKGNPTYSSFSQLNKTNNPYVDPTGFVRDYIPTSRGDGIQKMQQFSQMVGDPDTAKNVIKSEYFGNTLTNTKDAVNPSKFVDQYNKLSPEQQNYLFKPEENQNIQAISQLKDTNPSALQESSIGKEIMHSILPALAGLGIGHVTGAGEVLGTMAGVGARQLYNTALTKAMSTPGAQQWATHYLTSPLASSPMPAITGGFMKSLSKALAPAAINNSNGGNS
jgi:hypothetical protein